MAKVQSGNFQRPDEVRTLEHGRIELVTLGEMTVGPDSGSAGCTTGCTIGSGGAAKRCGGGGSGGVGDEVNIEGRATAT